MHRLNADYPASERIRATRPALVAVCCYAVLNLSAAMALLEQKIRRYEHMRWAQEPNRRTLPFAWGLEYIGGEANESDPRDFLEQFVEHTIAHSDEWYEAGTARRLFARR